MVMTKDMQGPVNYQSQEFFSGRNYLPPRICPGDISADIDVSYHRATFTKTAEAEGYDVGRTVMSEVAPVQF